MMSFPRYAAYKDSGVEWLGDVPEHWIVSRLKRLIERNDGGVWGDEPDGDDDTIVLRSTEQTVDGRWKLDDPARRKLSATERDAARLEIGDLLITKSSGSSLHIGKATIVTEEIARLNCCYSNFMQRIRLRVEFDPRLAWHLLNNEIARTQFDLASNSTTGLANLNGTMIGEVLLAVPPSAEQTAIAAFLDSETAKIDALVAGQERLIALLKEKRQVVISHAVTKGLNPDAPMKPSGIEWLGEVPAHWDVRAMRTLSSVVRGASPRPAGDPEFFDGDCIPWVTVAEITKDDFKDLVGVDQYLTAAGMERSRVFKAGTVIYSNSGATLGVPKILRFDACANDGVVGFESLSPLLSQDFLYRFLASLTAMIREEVKQGSGQPNLNTDIVKAIRIPLPPMLEQAEICRTIEVMAARFDMLTSKAEGTITLLKERRSALIAAAVTGQIDVRGPAGAAA